MTIPTPITGATYWHRSLNPKKLVEVKFSSLAPGMTMSKYVRSQKLPKVTSLAGMRPMTKDDVGQVCTMLNEYLTSKSVIRVEFNEDEIAHFLLPRDQVIYSYVVESQDSPGKVTDFFSFYCLPSSILRHEEHKTLHVAYSYYNFSSDKDRLRLGMRDLLIIARDLGFDVFNCLDVMENSSFLEDLNFGIGDGMLHYYLYNWRVKGIIPKDLGMVLV